MPKRPFLTAHWTDLVLLNFVVPVEVIARIAPTGTEPDLHEGVAYVSMVGFRFHEVRVLGLPIPGHTAFDEINLRYYVKHTAGDEVRRGVVFIREIVPRRAVAVVANLCYNENYVTRPMRSVITKTGATLDRGDAIEYSWQTGRPFAVGKGRRRRWKADQPSRARNRLAVRVAAPPALPEPGSLDEFIVEHYWGYVRGRDGHTREYRVAHPPWRVAPAEAVVWDCDLAANYPAPYAELLADPPASSIIAEGSAVQVFPGRRLTSVAVAKPT